ncbi:MAG: cob(I)yrinic acid a,c-diamide adenosyltransferase [Bacteroidaceae bacterium]|nr:cob(I)yrinic acid a,c-diamide adenosyltransferase [Bacteroidaceae bacterium]
MPLYTRTGDAGTTSLVGGQRVPKTHVRLEAYGTIDELNSFIGLLIAEMRAPSHPIQGAPSHPSQGAPSHPPRGGATISSGIPAETQVPPRGDLEGAFAPPQGDLEGAPEWAETLALLADVQSLLFSIGSILATDTSEREVRPGRYIEDVDVATLEHAIDAAEEGLPGWRGFILPGGTRAASLAHVCRTVCRRAERAIYRVAEEAEVDATLLRYVNRLSDYFFALAKQLNHIAGHEESYWKARS